MFLLLKFKNETIYANRVPLVDRVTATAAVADCVLDTSKVVMYITQQELSSCGLNSE